MPFFVYYSIMKTIVVACSGGPDSMALLDMLRKENKKIIVCHVNYQKRDSAIRDENIVIEYCIQHDIEYRVCKPIYDHSNNFQAWARDVRYAFFEKTCDEFDTKDIYVAHHMDDHIETYIFQSNRNMLCSFYGLKNGLMRNGYCIHRPLLEYTKDELRVYCEDNGISYGIDESNLTNNYTRNQIRHSIIDSLSKEEKEAYCEEIKKKNMELEKKNQEMHAFLLDFSVDTLLEKKDNWRYLDWFLYEKIGHHFSKKYMMDLCEKLSHDILLDVEGYDLERFQNILYCVKKEESVYQVFEHIEYGQYSSFEIKENGKTIEGITLSESDFPIVIRNVKDSDKIKLRIGSKNVHRFFVDRKIPKHIRKNWLVVENKDKHVVFVPKIGCDVEHFSVKPNVFMIQYNL